MNIYLVTVLSAVLAVAQLPSSAADKEKKDSDLLSDAWKEYGFQETDKALSIFRKAEQKALLAKNMDDFCHALTGQAFCHHFGRKNNVRAADYQSAVELYDRCLKEGGEKHRLVSFWKSMKAECLYHLGELGDARGIEKAEKLWAEIKAGEKGTIAAQESMLFRAVSGTRDFNGEKVPSYLSSFEDYLSNLEKDKSPEQDKEKYLLAPVMANYVGNVYYWRGDYRRSVEHMKAYCKLGPTSFQYRMNAYFFIARVADIKAGDAKTAVEYYRKLYYEGKSDSRAYYAWLRAGELSGENHGEK